MDKKDYETLPDEELVILSRAGDAFAGELLYGRYKNTVRVKARPYFLIGADREDLIQEGMIGLYKAVRDYQPNKQAAFRTFAEKCIVRQLITAIKAATRQKHIPLNSYVSLYKPVNGSEQDRALIDVLTGMSVKDPEELIISQESVERLRWGMEHLLSPLEKQVLALFLEGKSYQCIAYELNRGIKTVDNALQRIKRKFERELAEPEL